jgi:hypothetical protein
MKRKSKKRQITPRRPKPNWHEAIIVDHHRLSAHKGVKSVAIGLKETRGKVSRRFSVKIYVEKKLRPSELAKEFHLPKRVTVLLPEGKGVYKARSVPTDVIELPYVELAQGSTSPFQIIPMGAQIGTGAFGSVGPGSQGCVVRHRSDNRIGLITAGHVISSVTGVVGPGVPVYQPDIASPNFGVGPTITGFVGIDPQLGAYVDIAIYGIANTSRSAENVAFNGSIKSLNGSMSLAQVIQNSVAVHKVGAVTGYTAGLFVTFHPSFVDPSLGTLLKVLEFVVDPQGASRVFGDRGDSGSVVVSRSPGSFGAVVGILFAISPDKTRGLVVPFEFIQQRAGIDVA